MSRADQIGLGSGTIAAVSAIGAIKGVTDWRVARTAEGTLALGEINGAVERAHKRTEIVLKQTEARLKEFEFANKQKEAQRQEKEYRMRTEKHAMEMEKHSAEMKHHTALMKRHISDMRRNGSDFAAQAAAGPKATPSLNPLQEPSSSSQATVTAPVADLASTPDPLVEPTQPVSGPSLFMTAVTHLVAFFGGLLACGPFVAPLKIWMLFLLGLASGLALSLALVTMSGSDSFPRGWTYPWSLQRPGGSLHGASRTASTTLPAESAVSTPSATETPNIDTELQANHHTGQRNVSPRVSNLMSPPASSASTLLNMSRAEQSEQGRMTGARQATTAQSSAALSPSQWCQSRSPPLSGTDRAVSIPLQTLSEGTLNKGKRRAVEDGAPQPNKSPSNTL